MKKQKFRDTRNDLVSVFDHEGVPHQMVMTNAREMVRHRNWTLDAAEAAGRRKAPVEAPPANLDLAVTTKPVALKPAAVFEDLSTVGKVDLRRAATFLGITEGIDGRSSEKRLIATIEAELDARLSASGDYEGPAQFAPDYQPSPEEIEAQHIAAVARRRRAYGLEAGKHEVPFSDDVTLCALVSTFASRVPVEGTSVQKPVEPPKEDE